MLNPPDASTLQILGDGPAFGGRAGRVVSDHRAVFQLPASMTSVVDAPRAVSSDASPTRPLCAVKRASMPAARRLTQWCVVLHPVHAPGVDVAFSLPDRCRYASRSEPVSSPTWRR